MQNKLIVSFCLLLSCLLGFAQTNNHKFDIKWFNEHKDDNATITQKGKMVKFYASIGEKYFIKKSSDYNPSFETFKYDKTEDLIMKESHFYSCKIGKQLLFDSMGNSREGIDYDEPFKFSVEEVAALIKEKYDIDILEKQYGISVSRGIGDRFVLRPYYYVILPPYDVDERIEVLIDGNNGDILIENISPLEFDMFHLQKNILEKYAEKKALSKVSEDKKKGFWSNNKDSVIMNNKKFDVEAFLKDNKSNRTKTEMLSNGDETAYFSVNNNNYAKTLKTKNGLYKYYFRYNPKGDLVYWSKSYLGMTYKFTYYYDDSGTEIKKIDNDVNYPFSIERFKEKVKSEFNIDIEDINSIKKYKSSVSRFFLEDGVNRSFYTLSYQIEPEESLEDVINRGGDYQKYLEDQDLIQIVLFDGITGGILKEAIVKPYISNLLGTKPTKNSIEEYLDDLKTKANTPKKTN